MIKKTLVPNHFEVPLMVETSVFRLRMLSINDLVKDYDAVMSSVEYRGNFDPSEFDAAVFMWVRDSAYNAGLDEVLYSFVQDWLDEK